MSVDMISISPANMQKQTWKVCISNPFTNCERIYPIQQSGVRILIDYLAKNPNVEKITIFRSSIRPDCHIGSDIDLYVELQENENKLITRALPFVFDLWTNFTVDDQMLKEIQKGGVVYERNTVK